jgi:hypothetical protein
MLVNVGVQSRDAAREESVADEILWEDEGIAYIQNHQYQMNAHSRISDSWMRRCGWPVVELIVAAQNPVLRK